MFYFLENGINIKLMFYQQKMNLLLDLKTICTTNIFLMETRPNVLFDGIFTKINYCDEFFTMYGIYINIPTEDPNYKITMNELIKLETELLHIYGKSKPLSYKMVFKLAEFLQTKFTTKNKQNCLKISGIWENKNNEYGLSFKF